MATTLVRRFLAVGVAGVALLAGSCGNDSTTPPIDRPQWSWENTAGGFSPTAVWGDRRDNVYFVGYAGTIGHFDGTGYRAMESGTSVLLRGVWCDTQGEAFAVGNEGVIVHHDGAAWNAMDSGTTTILNDVWGSAADNVFAVGDGGTILHFDGAAWSPLASGRLDNLRSIWGSSADDIYVCGAGRILHYDGTDWSDLDVSGDAVSGTSPSNVFVLGSGGVLHFDGVEWNLIEYSQQFLILYDVWGNSGNDIYVCGGGLPYSRAYIYHYDGTFWSRVLYGETTPTNAFGAVPATMSTPWGTARNRGTSTAQAGMTLSVPP